MQIFKTFWLKRETGGFENINPNTRMRPLENLSARHGIAVCTDGSRLGSKPARMTLSSTIRGKRGGRRILVVDDEPGILQYLRRVLEHGNHTVLTSRSGEHASGVLQRSQAKLDLVLTDIIMPGSIDGPTLARRLSEDIRNSRFCS